MKLTTTKIHQNSLIVRLLSHPWLVSQISPAPSETWSMGGACDRLFSIPPMFLFRMLAWFCNWSPSLMIYGFDHLIGVVSFALHFNFFWPSRNLAIKNPQNHPAAPHLARWPSRWSRPSWAFWVSASLIPCMALIRDSWAARSGRSGLPRWPCQVCQVYQDGCGHSGIAQLHWVKIMVNSFTFPIEDINLRGLLHLQTNPYPRFLAAIFKG